MVGGGCVGIFAVLFVCGFVCVNIACLWLLVPDYWNSFVHVRVRALSHSLCTQCTGKCALGRLQWRIISCVIAFAPLRSGLLGAESLNPKEPLISAGVFVGEGISKAAFLARDGLLFIATPIWNCLLWLSSSLWTFVFGGAGYGALSVGAGGVGCVGWKGLAYLRCGRWMQGGAFFNCSTN